MKILLINTNPVVSRLLALCTRDKDLCLDEVAGVEEIKAYDYDLLFVDDGSYVDAVDALLVKAHIGKKIFISYVKEYVDGFDLTIQKPFLPSQIIQVIQSVDEVEALDISEEKQFIFPLSSENTHQEMCEETSEDEIELPELSPVFDLEDLEESTEAFEVEEEMPLEVLNSTEVEKIKALLEMDDEESEEVAHLSEDEVQLRKVEVIKEQLISEGLEILDEDEIIDALSTKTKEKALKCKKNKVKYKKEQKRKQAMLHCSKQELYQIEKAMTNALVDLGPKVMKKFLKGKTVAFNIKLEDNE